VRWHVTFRAAEGSDFSREGGVLALESAPRECDRLELQVADVEHTSTDDRFIPLRDGRQLDRVPDAEEAAYFVARFQELAKYPRTVAARWNCDAIRERCAGKDVSVFSPAVRETSPGVFESTPGAAATIDCSQIDRSIAVCREWEANSVARALAVADAPQRPRCKGLLVTRRTEGGKSVELRAIGEDGAEWGSVSAAPGLPVRPLAVALAPLTVPADVVLMGVEGLVLGVLALILLPAAR
jgi:hypothetical protein